MKLRGNAASQGESKWVDGRCLGSGVPRAELRPPALGVRGQDTQLCQAGKIKTNGSLSHFEKVHFSVSGIGETQEEGITILSHKIIKVSNIWVEAETHRNMSSMHRLLATKPSSFCKYLIDPLGERDSEMESNCAALIFVN